MRISDWSSDVCSSDLPVGGKAAKTIIAFERIAAVAHETEQAGKDSGVDPAIGRRGANLGEQFILAKRRGAGERHHMMREHVERAGRPEERRVGKEWVSTCRSRGSTVH